MDKITIIGKGVDAQALAIFLDCKRFKDAEFAVRYGNRRTGIEYKYVLNDIPALEKARNKLLSLEIFEQNDIRVPEFYKVPFTAHEDNNIWFGRKINHKQGKDIIIHQGLIAENEDDYVIKYIPVKKEYRFHVFRDKILQVCLKYKETGTDGVGNEDDYIRNLEHGWKFTGIDWPDEKGNRKASEFAIKAVKCLNLDFGAVDIILGKDEKYYVLEVNTAPGLDTIRCGLYIKAIKEWVKEMEFLNKNKKIAARIKIDNEMVKYLIEFYNVHSKSEIEYYNQISRRKHEYNQQTNV